MERTLLGTGIFSWPRMERVSDRYGVISLGKTIDDWDDGTCMNLDAINPLVSKRGHLVCRVKETRESHHIGDMFRGVCPTTPEVGEEVSLNDEPGRLILETNGEDVFVGIKPDEDRPDVWLDPTRLYRVHDQTVDLFFHPEGL